MEIRKTLQSGQPGTRKYVEQYGESLVCIRYRHDAIRSTRLTTVELITEERPWKKHPEKTAGNMRNAKQQSPSDSPNMMECHQNRLLSVRIEYGEVELGKLVKSAGGRWNREKKVWELAHSDMAALGLLDRVVYK